MNQNEQRQAARRQSKMAAGRGRHVPFRCHLPRCHAGYLVILDMNTTIAS